MAAASLPRWREWGPIVAETFGAMAAATLIAWPFSPHLPVASLAVVYLLAVSWSPSVAALPPPFWRRLGFLTTISSSTPYYSLAVEQSRQSSPSRLLISAVFTGTLASRLKAQVDSMQAAQRRTERSTRSPARLPRPQGRRPLIAAAAISP
jgi:two-component system sensor histidine kinase KdpD